MTRSTCLSRLHAMPPQMRAMVSALLEGPRTSVELNNLFCISFSQQLGKARRWFGVPVISEPVEGHPYYSYRLDLEPEALERTGT